MEQLTIDKAIELLEPIPEEDFITGSWTDGVSKCCSSGHLRRLLGGDPNCYDKNYILGYNKPFDDFLNLLMTYSDYNLVVANDDLLSKYPQATPKQRTLALLSTAQKNKENRTILHYEKQSGEVPRTDQV